MIKIFIFFMLTSMLQGCLPYYYDSANGCVANPYIYHELPQEWLAWERVNWSVSCSRNRAIPPVAYNPYNVNEPTPTQIDSFGNSNPFVRFF